MRSTLLHRWTGAVNGADIHQRNRLITAAMIAMLLLSSMGNAVTAQESDPPDPKISVSFPELTLDCTGALSFTSVVIIDYYRFEKGAIVDIYDGDPDNGGTVLYVFDAPLEVGTNTWSLPNLLLVDHDRFDFWIHVRWSIHAWNDDSAPDFTGDWYAGSWSGTEKAPASDCSGVDPAPTPTLADQLVATLKRILSEILNR